jgi:hypothetical protein
MPLPDDWQAHLAVHDCFRHAVDAWYELLDQPLVASCAYQLRAAFAAARALREQLASLRNWTLHAEETLEHHDQREADWLYPALQAVLSPSEQTELEGGVATRKASREDSARHNSHCIRDPITRVLISPWSG